MAAGSGQLIPGLIATIIDWFKMLANWVERQLYAVDEWLRFRGGDSQRSLAVKAILGLAVVPHRLRIPIRLLPARRAAGESGQTLPRGHGLAQGHLADGTATGRDHPSFLWTVSTFIDGIPGIFGFIAWELKENWRLYRSNRALRLRPVTIGSHEESMRAPSPGVPLGNRPQALPQNSATRAGLARRGSTMTLNIPPRGWSDSLPAKCSISSPLADWGEIEVEIAAIRFGCHHVVVESSAPGSDPMRLAWRSRTWRERSSSRSSRSAGWTNSPTRNERLFVLPARGLSGHGRRGTSGRNTARESEAPLRGGLADLARRVTWSEWIERWSRADGTGSEAGSNRPIPSHTRKREL